MPLAEYGVREGLPVAVCHGFPGSRRQRHPDESIARRLGARLLVFDRAGYGLAAPQPGRTSASVAGRLRAALDVLGVERCAVAGISGGGPYAVALCLALGPRAVRLALVSSVAPCLAADRWQGHLDPVVRRLLRIGRHVPAALVPVGAAAGWLARAAPDRYLDLVGRRLAPDDRRMLARPEVRAMFREDLAEAFRSGSAGLRHDLPALAGPWDADPAALRLPTDVWHGRDDRLVPVECGRTLAAVIPGARLHLLAGGHFTVFDHWASILGTLLPPGRAPGDGLPHAGHATDAS